MKFLRETTEDTATARIATPVALVLLVTALAIAALLFLAGSRTDSVSFQRQQMLVDSALAQQAARIATEQEMVTLKDSAVVNISAPSFSPAVLARMDRNWGAVLHRFLGHDETYMLRGNNEPFFAMMNGTRVSPDRFEAVREVALPIVAELRRKTRTIPPGTKLSSSPHAFDFVEVNGHPAILSVKPVISDSGVHTQPPGKEGVHISVMQLDGRFIKDLSGKYLLQDARFSRVNDSSGDEIARPFVSRRGQATLGYFIWRPYAPGSIVLKNMLPALFLTLIVIGAVISVLLRRIQRSTARLQASEAQAKHLAFHDVLTGLPNRALFDESLDRALAVLRRQPEQKAALLCLDVDRFKKVNDTLGHPAGDELIRELGRRLRSVTRDTDTVARLGGDEFAIIQTGVRSTRDIERLCRRILSVVNQPFDIIGSQVFVGMSIGVACATVDATERTELARKADIALYHAKNAGRGRYSIFAPAMDATVQIRQGLEHDLRVALKKGDQLQVYYQPLYNAASKSITGVEALVRWQHPKQGLLCPTIFIAVAEESGLIEALGEWVLTKACNAAIHWPTQSISVNVSVIQLRNPLFGQQVLRTLATAGLRADRLELEITETAFLENFEQCEANLKMLRESGVRIALDDFGTGYSSFSHLRDYAVDRLKIDRSFTSGIDSPAPGSAIIRAIVDLARASGLKVTAEGVETVEQSQFLCSAGCDELQGYLMSRPVTLSELDALIGIDPVVRATPLTRAAAA